MTNRDVLVAALRRVAHLRGFALEERGCNGLHVELDEGIRAVDAALAAEPAGLDVERLDIAWHRTEPPITPRKLAAEYARLEKVDD